MERGEEREVIKTKMEEGERNCQAGDFWFLISSKWWLLWKEYVQDDPENQPSKMERPGPMDNSDLMENGKIKRNLMEQENYYLLPKLVWEQLFNWYGGGPKIQRKMIRVGLLGRNSKLEVEIYPLELSFVKVDSMDPKEFKMECSKSDTVKELIHRLGCRYYTPPHKIKLYMETTEGAIQSLSLADKLEDALISPRETRVIVEICAPEGWRHPSELVKQIGKQLGRSFEAPKIQRTFSTSLNQEDKYTGAANVEHAQGLTEYFLSGSYINDLNPTNPLGMQGKIAEHYAYTLKKLWAGNATSIAPTDFKWNLGKFAPQFSGFRQHDSQELLAFLLDGLHEDLNRVVNKPYVEETGLLGKSDEVASQEAWEIHLRRNQSVIVDKFQGQLKSTLICPKCQKISITFDPFMYLSLPLPIINDRLIDVLLFRSGGVKPTQFVVRVPKRGKVGHLKQALADLCGIEWKQIVLADIHYCRIVSFLEDDKALSNIRDSDIILSYQIQDRAHREKILVQILHRRDSNLFGNPLLLSLPQSATGEDLYSAVCSYTNYLFQDTSEYFKNPPFILRIVNQSGNGCGKCRSLSCSGCSIDNNSNSLLLKASIMTVCIDWFASALESAEKITEVVEIDSTALSERSKINKNISLLDCFDLFLEKEQLGPNDTWFCPECKELQQATKKFDIFRTPEILVIHLKRFQYTKYSREKLDHFVDYPVSNFDLSSYTNGKVTKTEPIVYDLFAISNHYGGLGGGHYTAYAKNHLNQEWYCFNDSSVSKISESQIYGIKGAYVLFYQKRK